MAFGIDFVDEFKPRLRAFFGPPTVRSRNVRTAVRTIGGIASELSPRQAAGFFDGAVAAQAEWNSSSPDARTLPFSAVLGDAVHRAVGEQSEEPDDLTLECKLIAALQEILQPVELAVMTQCAAAAVAEVNAAPVLEPTIPVQGMTTQQPRKHVADLAATGLSHRKIAVLIDYSPSYIRKLQKPRTDPDWTDTSQLGADGPPP